MTVLRSCTAAGPRFFAWLAVCFVHHLVARTCW